MDPGSMAALFFDKATAFAESLASSSDRADLRTHLARVLESPNHGSALQALDVAIQALDPPHCNSPSSLKKAQKTLKALAQNAPFPSISAFSSLYLSFLSISENNPLQAAINVATVFAKDPSMARSEVAPLLWEEAFLPHFGAALKWYKLQREIILQGILPVIGRVSENQASELRELERVFDEALDENTRNFAGFYKEWFESGGNKIVFPEVWVPLERERELLVNGDGEFQRQRVCEFTNGRYNPVWEEAERSMEISEQFSANFLQRVLQNQLQMPPSTQSSVSYSEILPLKNATQSSDSSSGTFPSNNIKRGSNSSSSGSELEIASSPELSSPLMEGFACSSDNFQASDDSEIDSSKGNTRKKKLLRGHIRHNSGLTSSSQAPLMADADSESSSITGGSAPKQAAPKDFVCPITTQIFIDPVTLETGQTYERKAIQEWLDRGNNTCPITRQKLSSIVLPKTNYVLKRLIASWIEQFPGSKTRLENKKAVMDMQKGENSITDLPENEVQATGLQGNGILALGLSENGNPAMYQPENVTTSTVSAEKRIPIIGALHDRSTKMGMPENSQLSSSPTSVISRATMDGSVGELRLAISRLCTSTLQNESEVSVLTIVNAWHHVKAEPEALALLVRPAVINGFIEIMFNTLDPKVLASIVGLLSELAASDATVAQTLTRVNSDVARLVSLFKNGLLEAVVLIYMLNPSRSSLAAMDLVQPLLMVIKTDNDGNTDEIYKDGFDGIQGISGGAISDGSDRTLGISTDMVSSETKSTVLVRPKMASIVLLARILKGGEELEVSATAKAVISGGAIEGVIQSLESDHVSERMAAVGILLQCIHEDGNCRNVIADKAELAPILECLVSATDDERFDVICFLNKLVRLNRRTYNEQILQIIKDECKFSTTHTLLIYLESTLQDQHPVIASLLLQLDILAEPRKMSMYREEAIDTLISCLRNEKSPDVRLAAAEALEALPGRFSSSGRSLTRAFLLKRAGFEKSYRAVLRAEGERRSHTSGEEQENLEEAKASENWERKMALVLASHEFGLVFEALAEGLKSRYAQLSAACFVSATWLVHMLTMLPDTGILGAARHCLLERFIAIFKSARDINDKALAMLALNSFVQDPEGMQVMAFHMKDILKLLRELKKSSTLAVNMLKILSEGQDSSIQDVWNHNELAQADCTANGEVLAISFFRDRIFTGHSDGTLKVWSGRGKLLHLIQELREHSKAITSLAILHASDNMYSGSLDKSVKVWAIGTQDIHCIQVHDMKDQIYNLTVANTIACFVPQGAGVKVHSWSGTSKLINSTKQVRCLSLVHGKIYCGCNDNSIQEIDLASGTSSTIQSGSRKLLGKANPVYVLHVHDGLVYSASTPLDGAAVKIWNASSYSKVGTLASTADIRSIVVSSELIYLGCKLGVVEIWSKEKSTKVGHLNMRTTGKVLCMALDGEGEVLVTGTADGWIQAWGLM
ncbi:hypothetical protein AMTRI_Chr05g57220 [Amborella trichopoda]|uniref:putative E3 ubiquitin-protein ligase LIN isoform X2 n=1 Tax=Amborella trichopoda TaxID=13333 RepID=UPI0009BFF136|nr:putative E3 ubiquitin-protein ligase LIN isoform X2 [Amborella trichopoda]|eukprot:XP_020518280.1 putative E3 ubiquitin-protein ligase LIN isoform X2 [Amborella trichopoda]